MMLENVPLQVLLSTFSTRASLECVRDQGCQGYGDVGTQGGSGLWDGESPDVMSSPAEAVECAPEDLRQGRPRCQLTARNRGMELKPKAVASVLGAAVFLKLRNGA